ncbi:MAG: putative lipid II flippase FtsW [bacterium]
MKMNRAGTFDNTLLTAVMILIGFGMVMVYSSSSIIAEDKFGSANFFLLKQLVRVGIALTVFIVVVRVDYHFYEKIALPAFIVSVILLMIVLLAPNIRVINGARRWIAIPLISVLFQPSDLARVSLIIFAATYLNRRSNTLNDLKKGYLPLLGSVCSVVLLIFLEPDFGTAFILLSILLIMMLAGGVLLSHLSWTFITGLIVSFFAVMAMSYRRQRIFAFLGLGENHSEISYQAQQSIMGMGAGGFWGTGLGESSQKYFFLPEPFTDFVFAILGEELGFIGTTITMILFVIVIWRGFRIALGAKDPLGRLLAIGITSMISIYAMFHIGVSVGVLPTTGIPLPFISYGGTSMVFSMMGIGILINISSQSKNKYTGNTTEKKWRNRQL